MSDHLSALEPTLDDAAQGRLSMQELASQWRDAAKQHQPSLPPRYLDVLDRVLSQLESSALFTEESCSFSQADMLGALRDWLHKARALGAH
ncbi:hypothetical protein EIP75_18570 [Aquabacterium soli]|jgi:hypothetical protein|uniref:Uncharacterized protein n=1 Tax=Aquabacterium soli TaxID=2493092 RepID=A0A3R8RZU9_9BURK|nr:hypothetical protein [Aquabacterium soli]RRS02781.1 hypothetical protein EIP75_18570 [Aquabacterium soli]